MDQNQILRKWRASEVWSPILLIGIDNPGAFDIIIRDVGETFSLSIILEKKMGIIDVVFPHRKSVTLYSVTFQDRVCAMEFNRSVQTFAFSVKNNFFDLLQMYDFDQFGFDLNSNHFTFLSVDHTIDVFFDDYPKFIMHGVELDYKIID